MHDTDYAGGYGHGRTQGATACQYRIGLRAAAPMLEAEGITLVIEPLNLRVNHPGYYLYSSDEAFDIVKEVASPCIKVLFDIYHQQITEGDVTQRLLANISWIGLSMQP